MPATTRSNSAEATRKGMPWGAGLAALTLGLVTGCDEGVRREFRAAAVSSVESGVSALIDGVTSGVFAALDANAASDSESADANANGG